MPFKILFVSDNMPFSSNFSGASSLKYSHLRLLVESFPQAEIYILALNYNQAFSFDIDELAKAYPQTRFEVSVLNLLENTASSFERRRQILASGANRIKFYYSFINTKNIHQFKEKAGQINPNLIWTENIIENYFVLQLKSRVPVIYSHYDFCGSFSGLSRIIWE